MEPQQRLERGVSVVGAELVWPRRISLPWLLQSFSSHQEETGHRLLLPGLHSWLLRSDPRQSVPLMLPTLPYRCRPMGRQRLLVRAKLLRWPQAGPKRRLQSQALRDSKSQKAQRQASLCRNCNRRCWLPSRKRLLRGLRSARKRCLQREPESMSDRRRRGKDGSYCHREMPLSPFFLREAWATRLQGPPLQESCSRDRREEARYRVVRLLIKAAKSTVAFGPYSPSQVLTTSS